MKPLTVTLKQVSMSNRYEVIFKNYNVKLQKYNLLKFQKQNTIKTEDIIELPVIQNKIS